MNLTKSKIRNSLLKLNVAVNSSEISKFLKEKENSSDYVDEVIALLNRVLQDKPSNAIYIRTYFSALLLPIVSTFLEGSEGDLDCFQKRCIALSILSETNRQVLRFTIQHFTSNQLSPFHKASSTETPRKKSKKLSEVSELEVVEACLRFLKLDLGFFRRLWDWDQFIEIYHHHGCDLQKFYCNQIVALLFGLTSSRLSKMNANIPTNVVVEAESKATVENCEEIVEFEDQQLDWTFKSTKITDVEGVYLPIFDVSSFQFYANRQEKLDKIIRVESTKINLRSLALGISSGKAICLSGPVGSGKTTFVEYLARKTGRLAPKVSDFKEFVATNEKKKETPRNKRKLKSVEESNGDFQSESAPKNGFLRIQLGDQTDSKILLGQYRCTDVPGEFLWQPGVLTQAVQNGFWLLLEDLDTATQDVCTVLTNLLENDFLCVPGFRENLKIAPGFQLFVTLRTQKSSSASANSPYSLMEKHLYTINIVPLSRNELSEIIVQNYLKLTTVSRRIVDVFLTFSSGCHNEESENEKLKNIEADEVLPYSPPISLTSLPNSGRMVSTRDLLKLCERSNPNFQITSSECAYFVFQNCVDLFCSHLPAGQVKTELIVSIGARLGIIESRCVHLSNEEKPQVTMTSDDITVGRVTVSRNSKEVHLMQKRLKMSEFDNDDIDFVVKSSPPPTFSFTRISSCILERISVAVKQNEPVLLVGETGVGKTSAIQYLSHQTNHKLVVVNMNNQSDVSDLIGGFKPVDMSFVIVPLRLEFEALFARTFDLEKNEKFLNNVSVCFNRGDFPILVKLMLKIASTAYKRFEGKKAEETIQRWQSLENKLKKLEQQLKNSINLSFAFIPGSLVNCIKNGDWVLLDEINLASTETLECLSTILEPEGSITLLERGDFVPIKRHPDFRIFSCMNPNTDVGKKDLPVGIRNRFTEFFVDELTTENDLLIIVGDYLNNTGIQKSRIFSAVKLYMKLRDLSQLELNDGLGNKPVFSLRTLCRALRICAKNLCGSIERNIYESFCLSFLTQLDPHSHNLVLNLIQKFLLSNVKKILSQPIPQPKGNHLNFEGYWIEVGEKEPEEIKEYILTESVKKNLSDLARNISIGKLPILLQGPTSAGKTSLIEYIAKCSGNFCLRINNHEHTDLQEYIGTYMADATGKLVFQEGVLVKAMRNGYWIILDELNLAPCDILEALNRVLDDNRELFIPETQVLVKAHPNFMLFATQNPPGLYGGRKTLSRAFKNRFVELHFSEIPKDELEIILEKRCLIPKSYAQKMVRTMTALQANRRSTTKNNFTLRDLFRWGNRYTYADKKLLENKSYDWNQHLIDEGYLALSAKVRNQFEAEIIIDALYQNFRKRISVENLFTLNAETSAVTRNILDVITSYKGTQNVVWTFEMRRMAVLVSKSLEFNEPVLLVGPTGCGKTTVVQILSEISSHELRILNCHMHTEGADFIGGLRPHRDSGDEDEQKQLFEWSDGPLILSMVEGNFFLADEISLAEDSVLERLNCVLEPERTILLAEKGGVDEDALKDSELVIKATEGFQFLATMNPGGDFGKKELSPALRNRFTEIWCTAINSDDDLARIAGNSMREIYKSENEKIEKISWVIVKTVNVLKKNVEKLNFSIRDVLAWSSYIAKNYNLENEGNSILNLNEAFLYGLQTLFLDALEMLSHESSSEIQIIREKIVNSMGKFINEIPGEKFSISLDVESSTVENDKETLKFGISPFFLDINASGSFKTNDFSFSAPTTKKNLFRILSALTLNKAILLEGLPGVGKTSVIENIANAIGFNIVRINLCEHTDLADLFGTDLPAESKMLEVKENEDELQLGSFVWRDGPLLAALKTPNTWILLDELNLAPQSVLEGLNAILDHRGEVYIPELNKTFKLGQQTRIFAAQNPLRQGGGRKGLPQSFLNRFTKVYLTKLDKFDLLHVIKHNFSSVEDEESLRDFKLLEKMVTFSERLETSMNNLEFGYKGGPYEANLRDILRWCKLLTNEKTGIESFKNLQEFILVLFEKMKLVYCQRMRSESDVDAILRIFGDVFECDVEKLKRESKTCSFYWNDTDVFFNDIQWSRNLESDQFKTSTHKNSIILSSQVEVLKNIVECVMVEKPLILCGPSNCGKTKVIDTFCSIFNQNLYLDTIDDSVTGSFQQFDFNRLLEDMWLKVETIVFKKLSEIAMEKVATSTDTCNMTNLFKLWRNYDGEKIVEDSSADDELKSFCKRIEAVKSILEFLSTITSKKVKTNIGKMKSEVEIWQNILKRSSKVLNTGGRFEWIDSVIVKSIKFGHFISLEHVNLVSSAILDRLNPVLEPNGSLLISEKGVGDENEPEIIAKHKNFRIFLTMDPKHGEISRAMRNRCIELSISRENYSEDDLRKIIFSEGVHEMFLIRAIIKIHRAAAEISEFSNFGVSQLTKMSYLVTQNKAMGLENRKALLISALEVYVRSSNIDLLGHGLSYYREKLMEKIVEEIEKVEATKSFVNFENLILKSNELTTMKLVKMQAEPLLTLLRCVDDGDADILEVLTDLSTKFGEINFKELEKLPKYLLTFLYMISSGDDNKLRNCYLEKAIQDENLVSLSKNLSKVIKDSVNKAAKIPWNSKIMPRLRPYKESSKIDENRINLALILEMSLDNIVIKDTLKRSDIDVITYSQAVQKKQLTDTIENTLVTNIHKLLHLFKTFVSGFLQNTAEEIDNESFTKILLSLLWFNRILKVTTQKLYVNNSVNSVLVDQLSLHFKWFAKHCVNLMSLNTDAAQDFMKIFQNMQNFILSHHHPMKLYKKIYVKQFTNFLPFYDENQVKSFLQLQALSDAVRILPKIDRVYDFAEYQKRLVLMTSVNYQNWRQKFMNKTNCDVFDVFRGCWDDEMKENELVMRFEEKFGEKSTENFEDFSSKIAEYQKFLKNTDEVNFTSSKFDIEALPIVEYFMIRILQGLNSVNPEYIAEMQSLNSEGLSTIAILNDKRFEILKKISMENSPGKEFKKNFNSLMMKVNAGVQKITQDSMLTSKLCYTYDNEEAYNNASDEVFINGPVLTSSVIKTLLTANGTIREIGLNQINQWKNILKHLKKVVWMNAEVLGDDFSMLKNNLKNQKNHATELISNVEVVQVHCMSLENENFSDFNKDFWLVIEKLKRSTETVEESWQESFTMNSLCGIVELNLTSHFPLMDPVKKNQLKTEYLGEDVNHLERLLSCYKFMAIIMDYENLGKESQDLLTAEIEKLQEKLAKSSTKVALRPEICVYSSLVKDVNHFLSSCCHPKNLLDLVNEVEETLKFQIEFKDITKNREAQMVKSRIEELSSKLDLWIINANKFESHTMTAYQAFYRDFVAPIESSVTLLKNGFLGLGAVLKMKTESIRVKESGVFWDVNNNNELSNLMKQLIEFPSKTKLNIVGEKNQKINIFAILDSIENSETSYIKLINAKLQEISNISSIFGLLTPESFRNYDAILNVCNQMWQKQEDLKRKRQAEEDSLYVTKTKCLEEDEEAVKLREIAEIFPNYAEEDFNEFLQNETLEQIIKIDKETKKAVDIIGIDDYKMIGDFFMKLMSQKMDTKADYLKVFEDKLKVFYPIFNEFKACLDNNLDDEAYKSLSLVIGLCQDNYGELLLKDSSNKNYNFYKDSNVIEAIACLDVMKKLENRVNIELEQWPEHAVLNDLIMLMNRIRGFSSNSPLARFNSGLQILRQKVDEWNSVAHRLNNFKDIEFEIAQLVQKFMRLELQCWRESLDQSLELVRSKAYRYWFFLYNLVHEFLSANEENCEGESSLVDFNDVEKRFAGDEVLEEKAKVGKISVAAITRVVRQFIESSTYAEFETRMKLVKSFENYLTKTATNTRKTQLIAILHNLHLFFSQFSLQVQEKIETARKPVEKKLKEFVKIESFNKDLSYFGMRSNIQRVHRHLHKIIKEFELEVMKKINDLLVFKDSGAEFNEFKKSQKSIEFNIENFILSNQIAVPTTSDEDSSEVLGKIEKYFNKTRKLVKKSLENAEYPSALETFQDLMDRELETCFYLRSLEVNREQPRNKQKSQAKHILSQKRKALTDFFKALTLMGISYKTGLLTNSLNPDIIDLQISPFSVESLTVDDPQTEITSKNLDLYFNKSVHKMKLLTNALLMPRPDMDHAFLERMKGFAIDLFVVVQDQRKVLSANVTEMSALKKLAKDIEVIGAVGEKSINFEAEFKKLEIVRAGVVDGVEVMEQFAILMKCSPEDAESHHMVIISGNNKFNQKSSLYPRIIAISEEISGEFRKLVKSAEDSRFKTSVAEQVQKFKEISQKLGELKEIFTVDNEFSVYGKPICDLHSSTLNKITEIEEIQTQREELIIDEDLDELAHSILISIQNIYKKFEAPKTAEKDESSELLQNHLKEKMHNELSRDIDTLNLQKVNVKLQNILNSIFTSTSPRVNNQLLRISPLIKQFELLANYFFIQQLSAHKLSTKMLSIVLSVFLELATKGFCVPQDLLSDEEQKEENDTKTGDGFGFEDGEGEKDVSDKLESEDQLDEAKKPEDYDKQKDKEEKDCKEEEKGIDMSDDFEGKMQDVDENEDSDANEDENEELDKEMGETEAGADKLDDQIWGSDDEEPEPEEQEDEKNEETGKGSGEKDEQHNDMDTDKGQTEGQEEDGLDAADASDENKKQQKKDIEHMDEQGEEEDQVNPYHNELEEPPQPDDLTLEEDMNLDNNEKDENENPQEDPFDIDKMKDNMEDGEGGDDENEEKSDEKEEKETEKVNSDGEDETEDSKDPEKPDPDQENPDNSENQDENKDEEPSQIPDTIPDDEKVEEKPQKPTDDFHESKDKKSNEENVQSMPNQQQKGSHDEVQVDASEESAKQEAEIDEQETGEDRDGVGQAENQESKSGHQGIADTKEMNSRQDHQKDRQQQKRKMGNTDEDRTLGEVDKMEKKTLKTIDKLNRGENGEDEEKEQEENDEFQHVKDAKSTDKTTLDNATEEQSKKIQHDEKSKQDSDDPMENAEEIPEEDSPMPDEETKEEIEAKKLDKKSEKASKNSENIKERLENNEEVEIDGDDVTTFNVPRGEETSAHCQMDIVNDASFPDEPSTSELFDMRKMVEAEVLSQKVVNPDSTDMEKWQDISNRMMPSARDLCEQLRLILEPTKCTRLKGDYRTGRRINMKKIIPYIASQFRKDKIWLRRTKAAQRDYRITIAVDDSKSMDHNNSKSLTLQAIAMVSQALTLLESGKLCVMSFGESPKILTKYNDQFNGSKVVKSLNFDQNQSRIAEMLNFSRTMNQEDSSSDNGIFENLLIVLSDGRNIFSEGEPKVKNAVKMARLQRMFIVYIIIDNPENKHSILDIRVPKFSSDMKNITMHSYLDNFPFPYYVIVRDLNQLPLVLSDGLRQWFELVNSEH